MSYEQKDNSGSLFRVENRESDKHPEFNGSAKIRGTEFWLSAWVNESKGGKKYFSIKFKPKDQDRVPGSAATRIDLDDEIPF